MKRSGRETLSKLPKIILQKEEETGWNSLKSSLNGDALEPWPAPLGHPSGRAPKLCPMLWGNIHPTGVHLFSRERPIYGPRSYDHLNPISGALTPVSSSQSFPDPPQGPALPSFLGHPLGVHALLEPSGAQRVTVCEEYGQTPDVWAGTP